MMKQSNIDPHVSYDILEATVIKSYLQDQVPQNSFRDYFSPYHELVNANE